MLNKKVGFFIISVVLLLGLSQSALATFGACHNPCEVRVGADCVPDSSTDGIDCGDCKECSGGVCPGSDSCSGLTPYCDASTDTCVECLNDGDCTADPDKTKCDASNQCVECTLYSHCPYACDMCQGNSCVADDDECTDAVLHVCKHVTSPSENFECVNCIDDADCTSFSPLLVCDTSTNTCQECVDDDDCPGECRECSSGTCGPYTGVAPSGDCDGDCETGMCFLGSCQLEPAGTDCGDCRECTMFGTCPTTFSCSSPTPYCETIEDECVECLNNGHCSSPKPYCDDDDTYKCFECELDDWVSFGTVSLSPNPYVINTIETVINSIDGVNIDLGDLSATYSQQKRGCCDGPDLIADGSLRADGSVDATISIIDLKLWPQVSTHSITANFFGLGSIEVDLEGGLKLTIDTDIGISVGKIYNACDDDDCISASLNASVSASLTFSMDAVACVDSLWSDEHCAGMTVSGTIGDLTFCGRVGCNLDDCTTPACSGAWGAEADVGLQVNIRLIFDSSEYDFPLPNVPIKSADAGVSCGPGM